MENVTDVEIKTIGMKCLVDALGSVGAERFIFIMNKDSSDYTEWRRSVFDDMSAEVRAHAGKRKAAGASAHCFQIKLAFIWSLLRLL